MLVSLGSPFYQTHWGTSGVLLPGEAVLYIALWAGCVAAGAYLGLRVARRRRG